MSPAYDYDLISSFPTVARDLIDIRQCNWIQSDKYIKKAVYGYIECTVTINNDVKVSPIIYEDEEVNLSTPVGSWNTYLTKGEVDFIYKWGIGHVVIRDGWWAVPKDDIKHKPLGIAMQGLLSYKEHDNKLVRELSKRISVGVYGKFGEEHEDEFGKYFNSCYFAEISSQVRIQVAEFIYEHGVQDNLIHVSVDGVLLDKEVIND